MLPREQVEQRVKRILALFLGQCRDGLANVFLILRPGERRDADILPAGQQRNVLKILTRLHPLAQLRTERRIAEPFGELLQTAGLTFRREHVDELGRTCGVGIDVAGDVDAVFACAFHHRQHLRHGSAPVDPADGLQMADLQRRLQGPRHGQHFLQRRDDTAPLLPHVYGERDAAAAQRRERIDQLLRRIEAFRRVPKAQRDAEHAVRQRGFEPGMQRPQLFVRQIRRKARDAGAQRPAPGELPDVQRQRRDRRGIVCKRLVRARKRAGDRL